MLTWLGIITLTLTVLTNVNNYVGAMQVAHTSIEHWNAVVKVFWRTIFWYFPKITSLDANLITIIFLFVTGLYRGVSRVCTGERFGRQILFLIIGAIFLFGTFKNKIEVAYEQDNQQAGFDIVLGDIKKNLGIETGLGCYMALESYLSESIDEDLFNSSCTPEEESSEKRYECFKSLLRWSGASTLIARFMLTLASVMLSPLIIAHRLGYYVRLSVLNRQIWSSIIIVLVVVLLSQAGVGLGFK
jgi:hypothetical protein